MAEAYYRSHSSADPVKTAQWRVDEIGLFHDGTWNDSGPMPP